MLMPRAARLTRIVIGASVVIALPLFAQDATVDRIPRRIDTGRPIRALQRAAEARVRERATEQYDPIFRKYTKRYWGVGGDWRRFKAQAMAESDLKPDAKSWVGARGLMQLMPATYGAIASKRPDFKAINDPESNIAAGVMHDRYLWRLWEKKEVPEEQRWHFMFASYNAGEGTLNRAQRMALESKLDHYSWGSIAQIAPRVQRWRYRETLGYVQKIDKNYASLNERKAELPGHK